MTEKRRARVRGRDIFSRYNTVIVTSGENIAAGKIVLMIVDGEYHMGSHFSTRLFRRLAAAGLEICDEIDALTEKKGTST